MTAILGRSQGKELLNPAGDRSGEESQGSSWHLGS